MHEFALASALIDKIEELKKEHGFSKVERVVVEIGTFSNVVPELFISAFDAAKKGTCADSAELVIEDKRGKIKCEACGYEYYPEIPIMLCPNCGELAGRIESGREFILKSLEVVDED